MGEFAEIDLDRMTAQAWRRFQARLADHVAEMSDEDVLVIEAEIAVDPEDGAPPYVQFAGFGDESVRCEVASNEYLAREHHLDHHGTFELLELGYAAPDEAPSGSPNFFVDLLRGEADRAAAMAVCALRDVFGVQHPAFLVHDGLLTDESLVAVPGPSDREEEVARFPHGGPEELQEFVDEALTPYFGVRPRHDDDGDIAVVYGTSITFVRVLPDLPVVRLFAVVVNEVKDKTRARLEVELLNRDVGPIKFLLVEDQVIASLHLPAWPFVPEHLRANLSVMSETVDRIDDDLALRVGGDVAFANGVDHRSDEDEDEDDDDDELKSPDQEEVHPALATIHELEVANPGSVDPRLVASICHMDIELILDFIRRESHQVEACHLAIRLGEDCEEKSEREREMQRARRSVDLLRRALRVVVDTEAGRESEEPDLWSSARAAAPKKKLPPKKRNAPDPTLEEVDPDMWRPEW